MYMRARKKFEKRKNEILKRERITKETGLPDSAESIFVICDLKKSLLWRRQSWTGFQGVKPCRQTKVNFLLSGLRPKQICSLIGQSTKPKEAD
jgi:hypothetical protein